MHGFSSFIRRSPPQEVARWMRQMRGEVEHKQVGISSEAAAPPRGGPQQGVGDEASARVQATVTDGPLQAASSHSHPVG